MDFTCRSCSTGRLSKAVRDSIFEKEQSYKTKPVAFGVKSKKNKSRRNHKRNTRRINKRK
jgi:hypothetical protein